MMNFIKYSQLLLKSLEMSAEIETQHAQEHRFDTQSRNEIVEDQKALLVFSYLWVIFFSE